MKMVKVLMVTAAASVLAGSAMASDMKQVSVSIVSIDGLPAGSRTSASVVSFGEPAKESPKEERRFEVGFVPSIPPAPGGEVETAANKDATPVADGAPMKADVDVTTELKGATDNEKTASIEADDQPAGGGISEVNTEDMELRLE